MPINEVGYGLDNFQKPLILNPTESLANILEHIFTQNSGSQPSDPSKYINIGQYLYKHQGTLNENVLRDAIMRNCMHLFNYLNEDDINIVETVRDGEPIMIISIQANIEGSLTDLILAFQKDAGQSDVTMSFVSATPEK